MSALALRVFSPCTKLLRTECKDSTLERCQIICCFLRSIFKLGWTRLCPLWQNKHNNDNFNMALYPIKMYKPTALFIVSINFNMTYKKLIKKLMDKYCKFIHQHSSITHPTIHSMVTHRLQITDSHKHVESKWFFPACLHPSYCSSDFQYTELLTKKAGNWI